MAKTAYQIKKSLGVHNGLKSKADKNGKVKVKTAEEIKAGVKSGKYDFSQVKTELEKRINFDTFSSDISSMVKTIEDSSTKWQTKETLDNNRITIESMNSRLGAYRQYVQMFGGGDSKTIKGIDEIQNYSRKSLEGWDDLANHYSKYKDATSYDNAVKSAQAKAKEYEEQKTADTVALRKEIAELEDIYKKAKVYDDKITKGNMNIRSRSDYERFEQNRKRVTEERDAYVKSVGYDSYEDLENALGEKKNYLNRAEWIQKGVELASVGDATSKNYDKDFAKKSKYVAPEERTGIRFEFGAQDDDVYKYINDKNYRNDKAKFINGNADSSILTVGYEHMTDKERQTYNYYYNSGDKKKANEYLNTITESLGARKAAADFDRIKGKTFDELTYGLVAGLDQFASGSKNLFNFSDEYIPVNSTQQLSALIREDLYSEHGNWGKIPYDLITTTTNMLPSILTSAAIGTVNPVLGANVGVGLLGASAAGNAYQEMLNLGYDKGQARVYSTLIGASEATLQKVMGGIGKFGGVSGKLSKVVSGIDNGLARFAIRWGGSALSEGFEEAAQEVLSPIIMNLAAGYDTGAEVDWSEVVYSGLLGALSGGILEGGDAAISTYNETSLNKSTGRNIKANERVGDMLDFASNPEMASAYEAYGQLVKKGVNAENVSDYQLGRLHTNAMLDAQEVFDSKKSTPEQRKAAEETIDQLEVYSQANAESRTGSARDIAKLTDANEKTIKTEEVMEFAQDMDKEKGALFVSLYDGETDVDAYAKAFNLAVMKTENNYGIQDILRTKNVLSNEQVRRIYSEIAIKADQDQRVKFQKLSQQTARLKAYKGFVDDSIIDYTKPSGAGNTIENAEASKEIPVEAQEYEETEIEDETEIEEEAEIEEETEEFLPEVASELEYFDNYVIPERGSKEWKRKRKVTYDDGDKFINPKTGVVITLDEYIGNGEYRVTMTLKDGRSARLYFDEVACETLIYAYDKLEEGKKLYSEKEGNPLKANANEKVNWYQLTEKQRKAITFMKGFAQATGMNLVITANENYNGAFEVNSNTIYLDIYAGVDIDANMLKDTIIPTASHELTHWMEKKSPVLFRKISNLVFETLEKHDGIDESTRIAREIKRLVSNNILKETDSESKQIEVARSEIVARACEDMLAESKVGKEMFYSLSKTEQKTLMDKVKEIIQNIKDWVSEALGLYKNASNQKEAQILRKYQEELDRLSALWDEMLTESVEVNQALEKSGAFEHNAELGSKLLEADEILFNEKLIETHIDSIKDNYSEESSLSLDEILSRYDKIIKIWQKLGGELNSDFLQDWNNKVGKDRTFTVFKKQAGYKYNVELSSMCKKGIPLFEAIDRIVKDEVMKELDIKVIGKAEKEILYDILKSHNFEIPCAICYVEQARQREGVVIDSFLNGMVEKSPSGKVLQYKLGWNETLERIQDEMQKAGFHYEFSSLDRSIATEKYSPLDVTMDEETQEAYFNALKKLTNEEIRRYNKENKKSRPLITKMDAESLKNVFKGKLPLNLQMFRTLFNEPSSRVMIDEDLLYSSMTTQNLAAMHNQLYSLFNSQGGVGGYKTKQGSIIYWGDILKKNWESDKLRNEGGVRNQSNSDFLMYTLLDHAQMYIDFTAKGYYLQAYTKVLSELKLFGLSKGKINASFIPKVVVYMNADGTVDVEKTKKYAGLDENGNPIYDDIEGINHAETFMLIEDAEYSKSIGGVCIGYSDAHIMKLLDDNRIQLIIGYHDKSNDTSKRYKGAIYAKNYNGINEVAKFDSEGKLKTVHIGFNQFIKKAEGKFKDKDSIDYKGKAYTKNDIPKLATDLYLEHCEKKGLIPAYSQGETDFSKHPNYYKLLADFSLYDINGNYAPHEKVEYNMPDQVPYLDENGKKAYEKTEDYIKRELKKELTVRDSISESLADKSEEGIIPQFVKRVNELHKDEFLLSEKDTEDGTTTSERDYSYDELISKDDLKGIVIGKSQQVKLTADGSIDAGWIVSEVKKKCEAIKTKSNVMAYYTNVPDIGRNVEITKTGIIHSFFKSVGHTKKPSQRDLINARVSLELPQILQNSIEVNRSKRVGNIDVPFSYVMMGTVGLEDNSGNIEYYAVRSVIEERVNQNPILAEAEILGRLYAINAKKVGTPNARVTKNGVALTYDVAYTYNIAQFLEDVKIDFDDTFSEDVYRNLGMTRKVNKFSQNLLYSERETTSVYDKMGEAERIRKENERLRADVERLNERLKLEGKVTHGRVFNDNHLLQAAGHLRNIGKSSIDKVQLAKQMKEFFTYITDAEDVMWEDVWERSSRIAESILAESKPEVEVNDYFKTILKDIQNTKISFSEAQKKEAQYRFGKNWNRYFFGRTSLRNDATPLDSMWKEWSSLYPDIFDADVTENDMVSELYDIISDLQESSEIVAEYDEAEQIRWMASEVYNQFWNIARIETTADKYDKKIKELNAEHRKTMSELRAEYEDRIKKQKIADDIHYGKLYTKLRDQKDAEIAEAKKHGKEMMSRFKENAEKKTRIQRITANASTLNMWLNKNSKDYHIHDAMKGPVIKLLQSLDFSSKSMIEKGVQTKKDVSFAEAFGEVRSMLQDATNMTEGLESLYGHDLAEDIKKLVESTYKLVGDNNYILNAMSVDELRSLDKLVRYIKKVVSEVNRFHVINHNQGAVNLANEFMEHGDKLGNLKKQHGKYAKFFEFRNRTPYYFFKSLGSVGEKLFEAFQDGWDKLAFNAKKVIDFAEETYTSKEVKEWSKETKTFKLSQIDGTERTVEMSIAQIMALHCVSKQEDAQNHLLSGGMTLKRIDKKGKVVADYENIPLSVSDIQMILSSLTDRQIEVADKLQNFMNTVCSDWGNEISMARFGIEQFGIPDYFPIKVSEATVPGDNTRDIDNASLFRLLNMSFTKARNENADQSIEIGDVFDIFAQHASDMAKYNALALPVLDFNKFYSIRDRDSAGKEHGVVQTLKTVFGDEANGYIRRFVRDLNGSQNVSRDVLGNTFFKNAKVASVAANLRVVLLQPTAFYKASAVMDNKYLIKASAYINLEPIGMVKKLKKAIDNAEKYCGIVQWKSLGYYDTDISKGLTEKIKHSDSFKDKVIEKSLKGAEIADKATFGTLWVACEFEIRDTRKDLKVGSKEFYDAIAKRLRDVIYATQVVDSTMTRSDMMRSSDGKDKFLTTFGSEPIIAYNMLLDTVSQFNNDKREFGKKEAIKKNINKVRKVVAAYVMTNAAAALVESAFDAFRDDDDEEMELEEFMKLYFKNFALDMSIGNKLPFAKDIYGLMQGYSSSRMDTQWAQYLQYALNAKKPAKKLKYMIQFTSQISGLPFYNVYRDTMAVLNKLDIFTADDLNEMFGDVEE